MDGGNPKTWSLQDAKNHFSEVVRAAERDGPQFVTRHGKEAAVIVSAEEYERLTNPIGKRYASFGELLLAMPQDDGVFETGDLVPGDIEF